MTKKKACAFILMAVMVTMLIPFSASADSSIWAIEPQYADVRSFSEGLAAVIITVDGWRNMNYIDTSGNIVIGHELGYSAQWGMPRDFSEGLVPVVMADEVFVFINQAGGIAFELKHDEPPVNRVESLSEGLAAFMVGSFGEDASWGFADAKGNIIIEPQFTTAHSFSEGLAAASIGEQWVAELWGFILHPDRDAPITLPAGEISVLINGTATVFDQPPIIQDGRTLVPLRAIFEAMGAEVDWDQATQTITATRDDVTISLRIGSNILVRNSVDIELDIPAQIVGGRTLVPVRAIAESFGSDVVWDSVTRTVVITSEG